MGNEEQVFFPKEKIQDVYLILKEIGGEKVINILTSGLEEDYWSDLGLDDDSLQILSETDAIQGDELFYRIKALEPFRSPSAIKWLGKHTNQGLSGIMAIKSLETIEVPGIITELINNSNFSYLQADDDPYSIERESLFRILGVTETPSSFAGYSLRLMGAAARGYLEYKSNLNMKLNASTIITCPFIPIELIISDTSNLLITVARERYRMDSVISLTEKFSNINLDNYWKNVDTKTPSFRSYFLTACYLLMGETNPNIDSVLSYIINNKSIKDSDQAATIFVFNSLIRNNSLKNDPKYINAIRHIINCDDQVISNAIVASIFYSNYEPLITEALQNPNLSLQPLIFSNIFYANKEVKNALIRLNNNAEICNIIEHWDNYIRSWVL